MAYRKIIDIDGVGPVHVLKLRRAGIRSIKSFLIKCASDTRRSEVSKITDIDEASLLKWANIADLYRIKGIGRDYSELLEKAGVNTVKELQTRVAESLHAKLVEANLEYKLVRQLPSLKNVVDFIAQANTLEPLITH